MSVEAILYLFVFEAILHALFYTAGYFLRSKWKWLILPLTLVLLCGAGLLIWVVNYRPDRSAPIEPSYCGLGAVGLFVIALVMIGFSLQASATGLPIAYLGSKKKKSKKSKKDS